MGHALVVAVAMLAVFVMGCRHFADEHHTSSMNPTALLTGFMAMAFLGPILALPALVVYSWIAGPV